MRHLLSSTILAAALALPAAAPAQSTLDTVTIQPQTGQSPDIEVATTGVLNAPLYVNRQGTAGNQDLSQGVAEPMDTWETVARISDIRTDADGTIDALLVTPEDGGEDRLLTLDDVLFIRDTETDDEVFVLLSRTADAFHDMAPFDIADRDRDSDTYRWAGDRFSFATPYTDGTVAAERAVGLTLFAGSVDETSRGLFDLTDAPANWTALGEIEEVAETGTTTDAFILASGGFLGLGEQETRIAPENLSFVRDTQGTLYAIYTGPRSAFPDALDPVDS